MNKTVKLKISGMHCTSCAMNIDGDLEDTEGVLKAGTSYAKQVTEVEFDAEKITVEKILSVINHAGYQAKAVE